MNFPSGAPANFAGLLGSSARKTVQWTVFSENGLASPGGKSRKLQDVHGGKGTARRAAVLCGISQRKNDEVLSMNERGESLESYFIPLLGGGEQ